MAKSSGNLSSRRSSSHNTKPYDTNNSFVKKVATKVTDFIPQPLWISKWFNTSQGNGDISNDTENLEEAEAEAEEDIEKPPPSKRPRIRTDIIHPPGTFSVRSNVITSNNKTKVSRGKYSVQNDTRDDFLKPTMAGPSGIGHLICSTPTTQLDSRPVTTQRSDLNLLIPTSNNGTANGMDDNSESSESTSGCSSLIPQTSRQEAPSHDVYNSPFVNRKRFIDEKLTFTNHLQSPRTLFVDSNPRDTLSNHRPSFNASVMTNTLDRASRLLSPFYSGNTTFGGANAVELYKRNQAKSLLLNTTDIQLKVPKRPSVQVKPSNTTVDPSGMSQTARKILEALEHFSSPISDAKKIPLKSTNITPSSVSKKRQREENESPSARVGLRPPTRELIVPTVPAIIKIRRREKLQDTTVAARKIVSAHNGPPPPTQEYRLGSDENENTKHNGKLKATAKTNLNEEDTIEIVNLPSVPLPISSLPNFNFTLPQATTKNLSRKEDNFKFASPIKVTNPTQNLQSINNFTFSSPINAENHLSDSLVNTSNNNSGSMVTSNFIWSGSSTAPRPKDKGKHDNSSQIGVKVASDLKTGSVVDILCNKSLEKVSSLNKAKSSLNTNIEKATSDENPIVSASEEMNSSTVKKPENLIKDTKQKVLDIWECDECLIRNINSETRCFACKALRPNINVQTTISSPTSSNIVEAKTTETDCFGSHFKISNIKWDCMSCSASNKLTDIRCVSCNAPQRRNLNQTNTSPTGISQSELMNKGYAEGSWECPGCMLRNDANIITCPCCKASQPNLLKKAREKKNKNTNIQAIVSTQEMNTTSSNTLQSSNSEIMEKFKPSKDSWECPSCMVRNADSVTICPCCNTTKPSANCDKTNEVQNLPASGFGDKFKKPEGSWSCDTCMLQNKAENLECVSCGSVKPGSAKPKESTTSTSSNMKFNFGIPAGSSNFKFGIDKADNPNKSGDSSINNFKFGSTQQTDIGKFTFGIPKSDKNDISKADININTSNAGLKTSVCNVGFQFNAKSDKTTISNKSTESDKETNTSFSFNVPKNENSTLLSEQQQLAVTSASTPFTFGTSKTEVNISEKKEDQKSVLGNITKDTVEPTTSTTESSFTSKIYDNTSLVATTTQNNILENPPNSTFSFTASSTIPVSSSVLVPATTCLPTYSQHSFTFTDAKTVTQTTTTPTFGQIATTSSSNVTSTLPTFSFGTNESVGTSGPPTTSTTVEATPIAPQIFTSVSKTMPLFNNVDVKTTVAFGTGETSTSTFATGENKSPLFGTSETKVPVFGNSENKSIFGTSENKMSVFGNTEKTTPVFSTPAAVATPAFGSQTNNAVLFGSSAPVFGNNNSSNFGGASAPNIFSTTKPNDNNVSNSSLFTFGAASNQTAAQPGTGFNFSANNNPAESAPKQLFTFGSSSNTQQTNNLFGGNGFNNAAQTNTGSTFTFNAPKPETPAFGQSTVATPLFGGLQNNQNQSTSTFSSSSSANTGFNFGNTTPATTSGGFTFGRMEPTSTPSGGYNFNPPSSTPAVSFDPNTPPSFNFTGGSAPISFNAPPPVSRKIKKAVRRMRYPANDSQR
uniref:nuclear pore complex protein Nup153 n=1 Tax=Vespula vulgaris TaxID=7454 RepID=UPI002127067F|nr:nuclear pore complex protein Nup153 [Vespula vulgaris]